MIPLYDYQREAVDQLRDGCILYGGVGSGKSRTGLAYYYKVNGGSLDTDDLPRHLSDLYIITTARKRDTLEWEEELLPFQLSTKPDNYFKNKVVIDSWNNIQKYKDVTNAFFLFDEQRVVGYGAWSKSFIRIARNNRWILLTATPGDTWMDYMSVFIANGFYKNKTEFISRHVVYDYRVKYPKIDRYTDVGRLIRYRDVVLRKMQYTHSLDVEEVYVPVSYSKPDYLSIQRTQINPLTGVPVRNASEFCSCLRRLVNSDESRQTAFLELLEANPKTVVFYNYDYELDILRDLCHSVLPDDCIAEWNGHKHQDIPSTGTWVYLVQYNAGSEAWNCTKTNVMVFWSDSYSYKQMEQAKGRIDRTNTPYKTLYYYHFRSKAPIDIQIARALNVKKDFNEGRFYNRINKERSTS